MKLVFLFSLGALLLVQYCTSVKSDAAIMILKPAHHFEGDPVICPNKFTCPSNNTCCSKGNNNYGCCPEYNAVCCEDLLHCCPNGSLCDVTHARCVQQPTPTPSPTV